MREMVRRFIPVLFHKKKKNNNDNNNIANSTEYKDMIKNYITPRNICEPYPVKVKPSLTTWVLSD